MHIIHIIHYDTYITIQSYTHTILYILTFEGLQALKLAQVPNPHTAVRRTSSNKITVFTERKVRNLTGGVRARENKSQNYEYMISI